MAVSITYTAGFEYADDGDASHSEVGVVIGSAAADRVVFVMATGLVTNDGEDIDALSIGGVAATRARRDQSAPGTGGFYSTEVWWAAVPTGTTATIAFTTDAGYVFAGFSIYAVTGTSTTAPISDSDFATRNDETTNALSVSVDVPANGGAIGMASGVVTLATATASWTYLSENLDNDVDLGGGGAFMGFSTASQITEGEATGQAVTATLAAPGAEVDTRRNLVVVTLVNAGGGVSSAAGAATSSGLATAAAQATAGAFVSSSSVGAATGDARSVVSAIGNASGVATAEAGGDAISESVAGSATGSATATAATAVIASVAGLAEGAAVAVAASPVIEIPVVTYPPVGGGGGIAPPYYSEQQRFRIRKEKSKPRVYVIKTGNWPTEEELARAEREEQREFSRFVNGIQPNRAAPVESDDEEELVAILSMLA